MAVFFERRRAPKSAPYSAAVFPSQEASRIAFSSRRTPATVACRLATNTTSIATVRLTRGRQAGEVEGAIAGRG